MKAFISIELENGDTLREALESLRLDDTAANVKTAVKAAPAKAEEKPAEEDETPKPKRKASSKPKTAEAPEETEEAPTPAAASAPKEVSKKVFEQIRKIAMAKINDGKRDAVEGILDPYGGLKGVPAEDVEDVIAQIEAL